MVSNFVHHPPAGLSGGCPLMNTAVEADDTNPGLLRAAREAYCQWRKVLEGFVILGQHKGEISSPASPRFVARIIISTLEGALLASRIEGTRTALIAAQAHLEDYIQSLATSDFTARPDRPTVKSSSGATRNRSQCG
jgi:hypothetical protein